MRRLLHHLVGLNSIVDPDLTEFDEDEAEALVADYLLVQERLDFRKGDGVDEVSGVNRKLLQRWLASVFRAPASACTARSWARASSSSAPPGCASSPSCVASRSRTGSKPAWA